MQIRLAYADRAGAATERIAHPLGLVTKGSVWYLVADTAAGLRTFHVNRVRGVELTGAQVVRPTGFDLAHEWERIAAEVDEHRSRLRATCLVERSWLPIARGRFGRRCTVVGDADRDHALVEVGATHYGRLAYELASFGGVEVLEPAEVRDELARIGAELTARYARSSATSR